VFQLTKEHKDSGLMQKTNEEEKGKKKKGEEEGNREWKKEKSRRNSYVNGAGRSNNRRARHEYAGFQSEIVGPSDRTWFGVGARIRDSTCF
jgi:hypothetical protein